METFFHGVNPPEGQHRWYSRGTDLVDEMIDAEAVVDELWERLTLKQGLICRGLMEGYNTREIGEQLGISRDTVWGQMRKCIRPKLEEILE
jgi:DNA-binding NarL/FixJ family response regulator